MRAGPDVLVAAEGLVDPDALRGLPVHVAGPEEIAEAARRRGGVAFLQLAPPEPRGGGERVTLAVRLAAGDGTAATLAGIGADFVQREGRWVAAGDPVAYGA